MTIENSLATLATITIFLLTLCFIIFTRHRVKKRKRIANKFFMEEVDTLPTLEDIPSAHAVRVLEQKTCPQGRPVIQLEMTPRRGESKKKWFQL